MNVRCFRKSRNEYPVGSGFAVTGGAFDGLTDAQKTLVSDLIEQTKRVIAKGPPAPEQ